MTTIRQCDIENLAKQTANVAENIRFAAKNEQEPETDGRLRSYARALRGLADDLELLAK